MNNTLTFNSLTELEGYINNTFTNKDDTIKNIKFKLPHSTEYKIFNKRLVKEEPRGKMTWEAIFKSELSGDWHNAEKSILITYTDRYIKTKDQLIFKTIESIETY